MIEGTPIKFYSMLYTKDNIIFLLERMITSTTRSR